MKDIVVLISGTGSNLEAILNACNSGDINGKVVKVISNKPDAFGLVRARKFNISTKIIDHTDFASRSEFDDYLNYYLDKLEPDLVVLAGFMRILGKTISSKYSHKMINLHPSLLPLYPGLDTHKKVKSNGDIFHGISIHFVSSELDGGPIIAQGIIKVDANESMDQMIDRIHRIEHILLPNIIKEICDENIYLHKNKVRYENIDLKGDIFLKKSYEI